MAITVQEHLAAIADEAVAFYGVSDFGSISSMVVRSLQGHPGTARLAKQGYWLHKALSDGWSAGPEGLRSAIVGLANLLA
jgi:hypothetical protein